MTPALTLSSLPLFPLGSVLFPGGTLALQVFEVRYLDMVRKCQQTGAPFGVVALTQGSEVRKAGAPDEQFCSVGTLATIEHFKTPQPGLITLVCSGSQRFRILQHRHLPHGLWVADVQHIDDDQAVLIPADLQSCAEALEQALRTLQLRSSKTAATTASINALGPHTSLPPTSAQLNDCGWVANRWCELLPFPPALKQRLMELDNPLVRLELIGDVLISTGILRNPAGSNSN